MKAQIKKYFFSAFTVMLVMVVSCVKEDPLTPSAEYTTNLEGTTAYANEVFYIYKDNVQGEFLTIFPGINETNRYNPEDPTIRGIIVDVDADSIEIDFYDRAGTYRLTLVASSSGNWAEDYEVDTFGIDLTVIDRGVDFDFVKVDGISGIPNDDGTTINFFGHKMQELSGIKPEFRTVSKDAVVTIDGIVQTSKQTEVDFSPLTVGDPQGRPVFYLVTAPSGASKEVLVQYILEESSSEKQLFSFNSEFGEYALTAQDETNKEAKVIYPKGADITDIEASATASSGAKVLVNDKDGEALDVAADEEDVDLSSGIITVEAEDLSTQVYDILLYYFEDLASMSFTQAGGTNLNPQVDAVIDGNSVTLKVLAGTDLSSVITEFTGIDDNKLYVGTSEIISGISLTDFSGNPVLTQQTADGTVVLTYSLVIEELSK